MVNFCEHFRHVDFWVDALSGGVNDELADLLGVIWNIAGDAIVRVERKVTQFSQQPIKHFRINVEDPITRQPNHLQLGIELKETLLEYLNLIVIKLEAF